MSVNIFKNKRLLLIMIFIICSLVSLIYLFSKKKTSPLLPTVSNIPTPLVENETIEKYYLRRVEFEDKFIGIFWKNNYPFAYTNKEQINLYNKERSKYIPTKESSVEILDSPNSILTIKPLQDNLSIVNKESLLEVANIPFDSRATKTSFVWKKDSSGIFLFEKINFPREVDYIYFYPLNNGRKIPLADSFPIPSRLNLSIQPEISPNDDLMFLDKNGGVWILSKTPPQDPTSYQDHGD